MYALIAGVHCALTADNELVIDPDHSTFEKAVASMTFVFESIHLNVVAVHTSGLFTTEQYRNALMNSKFASKTVFDFYRDEFKNKTFQDTQSSDV